MKWNLLYYEIIRYFNILVSANILNKQAKKKNELITNHSMMMLYEIFSFNNRFSLFHCSIGINILGDASRIAGPEQKALKNSPWVVKSM